MKDLYEYTINLICYRSFKKYIGIYEDEGYYKCLKSNLVKIPIPQFMIREDSNNQIIEDDYYFITKDDYSNESQLLIDKN